MHPTGKATRVRAVFTVYLNSFVLFTGLDFWQTCSVLGYCLLPVIFLAALGILVSMKGFFGLILATGMCTNLMASIRYQLNRVEFLFYSEHRVGHPCSNPPYWRQAAANRAVLARGLPCHAPVRLLRHHHHLLTTHANVLAGFIMARTDLERSERALHWLDASRTLYRYNNWMPRWYTAHLFLG